MTKQDPRAILERLREVEQNATEGPWEHRAGAWRIYGPGPCTCGECDDNETVCRVLCRHVDDAAFIALSRDAVPAMRKALSGITSLVTEVLTCRYHNDPDEPLITPRELDTIIRDALAPLGGGEGKG